jgi:hypothetical protein
MGLRIAPSKNAVRFWIIFLAAESANASRMAEAGRLADCLLTQGR